MSRPPARLFYGWIVVAAAFAMMFLGFGAAYTFSTFVASFEREFAASRGTVALVFSLAGFLYFGLGIVSGPLADRWGARRLALAGMALIAAGLALASVARTLPQVYAAYGLGVGLGVGASYVPSIGAVQRWFVRRRGLASGVAVSGIGVGTLVMPPLASRLIDALGWRGAYLALAVTVAVLGLAMAALLVDRPADRGLAPDGAAPPAPTSPGSSAAVSSDGAGTQPAGASGATASGGLTLRDAIRTRRFGLLYAACLVCGLGLFVPFVHLVPYARDHGQSQTTAALLLGLIGVGSTAGRFALGGIGDRIGRQAALLLMFLGMAATLVVWAVSTGFLPLALFAVGFGSFYGGFVAIMPSLVMDSFGGRHVSSILGALYTSVAFGTLVGPPAAGLAYDLSHSYRLPILASIATNLVAAAILTRIPPLPRDVPRAP